MVYSRTIIVPAGTPTNTPVKEEIALWEQNIDQIDVKMDTVAAKGYLQLKIIFGDPEHEVYIWPRGASDYIISQGTWNESIRLPKAGLKATIIAQSPGATHNHTAIVTIHTTG